MDCDGGYRTTPVWFKRFNLSGWSALPASMSFVPHYRRLSLDIMRYQMKNRICGTGCHPENGSNLKQSTYPEACASRICDLENFLPGSFRLSLRNVEYGRIFQWET